MPVQVVRDTFCNLCCRFIKQGEDALQLDENHDGWFIHPDCAMAEIVKAMHNHTFRRDVKKRPQKRRTHTEEKKIYVSEGAIRCMFCRKTVREGAGYVKDKKKCYHVEGANSCWIRYRRALSITRASIQGKTPAQKRGGRRTTLASRPL